MKFLNRAHGNVCGSRTDGLVRDINTIDLDTCRATEAAEWKLNDSQPWWDRSLAILNLNARFELGKSRKLRPFTGKIFDLARRQNPLYRGLFRVHLHLASLHFHHCAFLADLQLDATRCASRPLCTFKEVAMS